MYEVNRSVFLLIPLDPFWNWLQTLPGNHLDGLTLEDIQADANSYLVRPCETADEVWDEIEARFEDIFAAELADWCEDESEWPDLNADIFNESTSSFLPLSPTSSKNRSPVKPFNPSI